jgi:hypothetical protein
MEMAASHAQPIARGDRPSARAQSLYPGQVDFEFFQIDLHYLMA